MDLHGFTLILRLILRGFKLVLHDFTLILRGFCVDFTWILRGCCENAFLRFRHLVPTKCLNFKFLGRGQRETPVGDIYTGVEFIMLLPGMITDDCREEVNSSIHDNGRLS